MAKKIRMVRTMVMEYTPDPEHYPEGMTIEEMAQLDTETDDWEALFDGVLESDEITFTIVEESKE